jgi:hypothetical protein
MELALLLYLQKENTASAESRLHLAKTRLSGFVRLMLKKARANHGGIRGMQELSIKVHPRREKP